jgi:hypothetical protein
MADITGKVLGVRVEILHFRKLHTEPFRGNTVFLNQRKAVGDCKAGFGRIQVAILD